MSANDQAPGIPAPEPDLTFIAQIAAPVQTPNPPSTPYSPGVSMDDIQKMSEIFKSWVDTSNLKWWIIAAGVGAIVETFHIIWLGFRFAFKF
jgi:hypothetical protein